MSHRIVDVVAGISSSCATGWLLQLHDEDLSVESSLEPECTAGLVDLSVHRLQDFLELNFLEYILGLQVQLGQLKKLNHLLRPRWALRRDLNAVANICSLDSYLNVVENIDRIPTLFLELDAVLGIVLYQEKAFGVLA